MSTISPGPASNANTSGNLFEAKATDDEERGKLTERTKGANATSAGHAFEARCAEAGGVAH